MYFGELIRLSVREHQTPEENCFVMRLMLNTLHYLESGQRSEALLKPIFELRLMTELKELAVKIGFRYDLTEIRIAGEETPEKQKRVFEALIETLGDGESIYADITFGHRATPLIIFTALSFCYKLCKDTEVNSVFYADKSGDQAILHDVSKLFFMESVIHSVSQSVPDDPLPIIKRILNM